MSESQKANEAACRGTGMFELHDATRSPHLLLV